MKMFERLLKQAPIFKDTVLAIGNLTKTANDLVKGYTQLAKMVIEDRKAINELYEMHTEILLEKELRARGKVNNNITVKGPVVDTQFIEEEVSEEKKKAMN
jgi:hypothetical protein